MPLAERRLFTDDEHALYGGSSGAIKDMVHSVLSSLTSAIGITRRGDVAATVQISPRTITVQFSKEPVMPEQEAAAVPIFPPGVDKASIREGGHTEPTETEEAGAALLLRHASAFTASPVEAVALMDAVMDAGVKRALYAALLRAERVEDFGETLESIHSVLRTSLGSAYWPARRNRIIAGHTSTGAKAGRAKHRAGDLPITTTAAASASIAVTTRWTVGYLT